MATSPCLWVAWRIINKPPFQWIVTLSGNKAIAHFSARAQFWSWDEEGILANTLKAQKKVETHFVKKKAHIPLLYYTSPPQHRKLIEGIDVPLTLSAIYKSPKSGQCKFILNEWEYIVGTWFTTVIPSILQVRSATLHCTRTSYLVSTILQNHWQKLGPAPENWHACQQCKESLAGLFCKKFLLKNLWAGC